MNKKKRCLVLGIDGCRPDALLSANAPNLHKLLTNSAHSLCAQTCESTWSEPAWMTIFNGVWENKHQWSDVEHANPFHKFPTLFQRLKNHGISGAIATCWNAMDTICHGADTHLLSSFEGDDEGTLNHAKSIINVEITDCPDLVFVYFESVDMIGHKHGFHPSVTQYINAIEETDERVGYIMKQIEQRKLSHMEDWLVIVCTDHGGSKLDEPFEDGDWGVHSIGDKPEHKQIFLMVNGKDIAPREILPPPTVVDIKPTILHHFLGREHIKIVDQLDGRSLL